MLALVATVLILGTVALSVSSREYRAALREHRQVRGRALEMRDAFQRANLDFVFYMLDGQESWARGMDSAAAVTRTGLSMLADSAVTERDRRLWSDAAPVFERWRNAADATVRARRDSGLAAALRLRDARVIPLRDSLRATMQAGSDHAELVADQFVESARDAENRMRLVLLVGGLLALGIGIAAAVTLSRTISEPLRETSGVLASSAAEILASTTQQASGAAETSAALTQTVTTVDEVARTAEQASQRAQAVADLSQRAAEIGKQGRRAVDDSSAEMRAVAEHVESIANSIVALAEQAQAIGEITTTVSEIAEQTNMLSLNAAVEAARAGDQGRGFAVVAGEIRALAEQSKKATVQVRQLLGDIQRATNAAVVATEHGTRQVEAGNRQVSEAGETIRLLVEAVGQASNAATQIVASAGQQAAGMAQIREAMASIHEATHQNLASTRQAENAAQDLNSMGQRLLELVGSDGRRPGVPARA
ncbi:MAG TPA: methyl-accepting chemotaxis protein [Nannocystaceae bacterium]|nr:methyl-accepting chemotaxis protein [Nannocystaceae bacterium]